MRKVTYANDESANTSGVKYANNKTRYRKPSVTDNSVINATSYFKLL